MKHASKLDKQDKRSTSSSSESTPDFDVDDVYALQEKTIVRFAASHESHVRESSPDQLSSLHFDEQMIIDSLAPPTCVPEPQFLVVPSFFQFSVTGVTPSSFRKDLLRQSTSNSPSTTSSGLIRIAPALKVNYKSSSPVLSQVPSRNY